MRKLMISLDKKIFDSSQPVARRMVEYGKENELFIVIPDEAKIRLDLSSNVHVITSGGRFKITQFFKLRKLASKIIKERNITEITTQDPFFTGLVGVQLKRFTKVPLEVQMHGDFYSSSYYKESGWMNLFRYFLGKYVLRRADKIRVVSQRIKNSLKNIKIKKAKIEVHAIRLSSSVEFYKNKKIKNTLKQDYPKYEKIFVWVGRMEPVKNLEFLIEVFGSIVKEKSNWLLLMVGDGSQRVFLEKKIKKLKLLNRNIRLVPWVNKPLHYIANADCVLFPSLSEGCGLVALEAEAVGTPIIMTDVGVANYELKAGSKVKIVPIGSRKSFREAILNL